MGETNGGDGRCLRAGECGCGRMWWVVIVVVGQTMGIEVWEMGGRGKRVNRLGEIQLHFTNSTSRNSFVEGTAHRG